MKRTGSKGRKRKRRGQPGQRASERSLLPVEAHKLSSNEGTRDASKTGFAAFSAMLSIAWLVNYLERGHSGSAPAQTAQAIAAVAACWLLLRPSSVLP